MSDGTGDGSPDVPDEGPRIDGRRRDQLAGEVRGMVPYYVEDWDPDEGDVGSTLLSLFAELAEEVTERLDRVPEKHRVAFYETLGFGRQPPQPARLPLSVEVADDAGENVTVPSGAVAKAKAPDGPEQLFEIPEGGTFDATPANLQAIYTVAADRDAIYAHHDALVAGDGTTLFRADENLQDHILYIGDAEQLAVRGDSKLTVVVDAEAAAGVPETLLADQKWRYYGEKKRDDEKIKGWHELSLTTHTTRSNGDVELTFDFDGALKKTTVDGVETKWLRCRVREDVEEREWELDALFGLRFGGSSATAVRIGASASDLEPDKMLHNDVPQPEGTEKSGETIRPFGEHPRQQDTFYLSSTDALTKSGAEVKIVFENGDGGTNTGDPVLSWEYFDGEGWSRLSGVKDNTSALTDLSKPDKFHVKFRVPSDLSETTVAGHEGHWIRIRLVGGDYGTLQFKPVDSKNGKKSKPDRYEQKADKIHPPSFENVRLGYNQTKPPEHAVAKNNLGFESVPTEEGSYRPFKPLPVEEQTLFLGFDGSLTDGPINLLFDLEDVAYSPDFYPQVRWEYTDPRTGEWARPDVLDETEGLTERGIVGLVFPVATESTREFGRDLHWVRARVAQDQFTPSESSVRTPRAADERGACGRFVETVPPAGKPGRDPPTVRGLYPNATWARNRRTIEGEILGSSDGNVDQTVAAANPPVIDPTVWVDELVVLSEGARESLRERWPDRTEAETDETGEPVAFWVRWERQADLLDSGPEERHYTLDPVAGTVSFGDGTRGKIPPRGTDNVRLSYATGGGAVGNVPAGAVSGFQQSLAFVDSVTNPLAGAAGADAEATGAVTDRAARQLRDRDRAVAPADFERIAMDASRQLARARCLPAMDQDGEYRPGWVTLLVVPDSAAQKPTPSATLRGDVERAVAEKAPARMVGLDRLVVRGPGYVTASVEAEVAATGGSISALEERVREAVRSYLHPLTGRAGDGWAFGELPCRSDFYELLEGVDRVDHVEELSVTFRTDRSTVVVAEGEATPDTSPDALVHSGAHDVTATLADGGGQ